MTDRVEVHVEVRVDAPAENYRIVMFRDYWRVYNARNIVMTTCETRDEAQAYIDRQAG